MATILDGDGEVIVDCTLEIPINGSTARLVRLPRANGLLAYYFGRNGRRVVVETPDGNLEGHLNTHWERFGRVWEVVLSHAVEPHATDTLEPAATIGREPR